MSAQSAYDLRSHLGGERKVQVVLRADVGEQRTRALQVPCAEVVGSGEMPSNGCRA